MSTRVYRSTGVEWGGWVSMDLAPRSGPGVLRRWMVQNLKVAQLKPLPQGEVPAHLRPPGRRWAATYGIGADQHHVLVISDDR